jgi:acyl carrier protein
MEILFENVAEILTQVSECDINNIQLDTNLADDIGVSSLMGLEILVMLERKYELKLEEEILFKMTTPRNIMDILQEEMKKKVASN